MRLRRFVPLLACCAGLLLVAGLSMVRAEGERMANLRVGSDSKSIVVDLGAVKTAGATPPSKSFTIEGNVSGLFPGGVKQILLTVRNPNRQQITVTSLQVVVGSSGPCAANNVWVTNFTDALRVNAQSSSTQAVPIGMNASAGNECKGAQFSLTFSGTAEMR